MNLHQRQPRILEDVPKPVVVETRKRKLRVPDNINLPTVIDHAVTAFAGSGSGALPPGVAYRRTATIEMSVRDWLAVPSNPRQRDELVRLEKNRVDHLLEPEEKHREVAMGILPDGRRYKVDGHTRLLLWSKGLVPPPESLIVDVYSCANEAAVEQLYDKFDNTAATEYGTDRVTGAYREAGIAPKSPMLREGGISTATRQLYHFLTQTSPDKKSKDRVINACVRMFADEIMLLDTVEPTRFLFPTGIVMGALMTLTVHPEKATEFWTKYSANAGTKSGDRMDAVQALLERHAKEKGKTNGRRDQIFMATSVAAVEGYIRKKTWNSRDGISAKSRDSLRKYADEVIAKKEGR